MIWGALPEHACLADEGHCGHQDLCGHRPDLRLQVGRDGKGLREETSPCVPLPVTSALT